MLSNFAKFVSMLATASFTIPAVLAQALSTHVPRKILFIGDSFTYYHDGIYTHFEKLAASVSPRWY